MKLPSPPPRAPISRLEVFYLSLIALCFLSVIAPRFVPVVVFPSAEGVHAPVNGVVTATLGGHKIRGCPPVKGSFVGWERRHDVWHEVGFEWVGDLSPDSSKPTSLFRQRFGLARWSGVSPAARALRVTLEHGCGDGPPRVTVVGPFDLPAR